MQIYLLDIDAAQLVSVVYTLSGVEFLTFDISFANSWRMLCAKAWGSPVSVHRLHWDGDARFFLGLRRPMRATDRTRLV